MTRSPADARRDESLLPPGPVILILLCAIVLLFRTAAWLNPSSVVDIPQALRLPTAALGVLYLACSVWAWRSNPSALTRVFLMYGIGGAVHWGGTIAAEEPGGRNRAPRFLYGGYRNGRRGISRPGPALSACAASTALSYSCLVSPCDRYATGRSRRAVSERAHCRGRTRFRNCGGLHDGDCGRGCFYRAVVPRHARRTSRVLADTDRRRTGCDEWY